RDARPRRRGRGRRGGPARALRRLRGWRGAALRLEAHAPPGTRESPSPPARARGGCAVCDPPRTMRDIEGLGLFYLGRTVDGDGAAGAPYLLDARDLPTHAGIVGMRG